MSLPPVRAITLGIAEPHPLSAERIETATAVLRRAEAVYREAGYVVQTVRLSTRPLFEDLADWPLTEIVRYGRDLQTVLDAVGVTFCSVGPAPGFRPDFGTDRIDGIADLLIASPAINATIQIATREHEARFETALAVARVMLRLAAETEEGFGNFRFAALACVPPGSPFFPAAYHEGPASLAIGLQGAGIVAGALHGADPSIDPAAITERVRNALAAQGTPAVRIAEGVAGETGIRFNGIDLSPAPMGEDSIVTVFEALSGEPFGSPGTLALAAAITGALKSTALPVCGYNGLMLPVLEDVRLGQRWAEGHVDVHKILTYSAVCGTGLDVIPLPGDSTAEQLARLLLDVAALAVRLNKPLSARLLPVPGTRTGDVTTFTSRYLTNTVVKW